MELAILVLAKECQPHARQSISLQQAQSFLEGVVDVDLASTSNDRDTSSTEDVVS
jgi:hypothetical protein